MAPASELKAAAKKAAVVAAGALHLEAAYTRLHRDGGPLPVVVCLDAEPDLRVVERGVAARWAGFEGLLPRVAALRERVFELTGSPASFSWFLRMDPQIADGWGSPDGAVEHYAPTLADLEGRGDELGVHMHTWRWDPGAGNWVRDHDPAWEEHCLDVSLRTFESVFGRPCPAHRAGDRLMTGGLLRRLGAGGVAVDLTVEPDTPPVGPLEPGELVTGLTPDYRGVPLTPYRSSPEAFPAPDAASRSKPLLIPLTSGPPDGNGGRKPLTPYLNPSLFARRVLHATRTTSPPVLAFSIRADQGALRAWDNIRRNLEHLAHLPGVRFVTAGAAGAEIDGAPRTVVP